MVNVYRGYSGTQQRSYVDPDLIRSIEIEKGSKGLRRAVMEITDNATEK